MYLFIFIFSLNEINIHCTVWCDLYLFTGRYNTQLNIQVSFKIFFFPLYLSGLIHRGKYLLFFFFGCRKTCTVSVHFSFIYLVSGGIDGKRERSFFWELYSRKTWTFLLPFNPHEIFWLSWFHVYLLQQSKSKDSLFKVIFAMRTLNLIVQNLFQWLRTFLSSKLGIFFTCICAGYSRWLNTAAEFFYILLLIEVSSYSDSICNYICSLFIYITYSPSM